MPKGPKGEKRPRDLERMGQRMVDLATGEPKIETPTKARMPLPSALVGAAV